MYTTISKCRICGNPDLEPVIELGMQALTGVFPKERETPVPVCPLDLVRCRTTDRAVSCGLVQLRHSFQPEDIYGETYGYRSGLNQSMIEHLEAKARGIRSLVSLGSKDLALDIGSNDGTLLRALDQDGVQLVGIDPSAVKFKRYYPPHIQLLPTFFSADRFRKEFGTRRAKVVTSIAMFYDLEAPLEFARQIHEILSDDGIWVFEQSYLPSMLARTSYDTICHEHLEYYALKQIVWILEHADFKAVDVTLNNANGGSFCVTAAKKHASYRPNEDVVATLLCDEGKCGLDGPDIYAKFRNRVYRHREELNSLLQQARKDGDRVLGYGASTKGNVILQFCGITPRELSAVAEVNPDKFGAFTPGTLIPIISEEEAHACRPSGFVVFPWHFRENIVAREKRYLAEGGSLVFPLPNIEVVKGEQSAPSRVGVPAVRQAPLTAA